MGMFKEKINDNMDDNIMLLSSDYEKALKFFENILLKDKDNIVALNAKGIALMKLEQYDKALTTFRTSLDIEENAVAYLNLGLIYKIYQNIEESNNCFDKALELNSDLKEILTVLKDDLKHVKDRSRPCPIKNN